MSTVRQRSKHHLRVSSYDKVSSWIVSLLIIMCVTVGALFIIFITRKFIIADFAVPVMPVPAGGGGTTGFDGTPGDGDPETPEEEATAFDEPIQDTLDAVATVVTNRTTMLDQQFDVIRETHGDNRNPGLGGGRGGGIGGGIGSGYGPGRGGSEPGREVRFEPESLLEYAQWLDYFKIELAVLDQVGNKVYYASKLSQPKPIVRVGDPEAEARLGRIRMIPMDSQFAALNRQLAAKAGIGGRGDIVIQFYPPESGAILVTLEQKLATSRGRQPETIRSSVFRVTRTGDRFEFSVIDQSYK
jgi:hypothetical protein